MALPRPLKPDICWISFESSQIYSIQESLFQYEVDDVFTV